MNRAIISRALVGDGVFLGHLEQTPACDVEPGPQWYVRAVNVTTYDVVPAGSRSTSTEGIAEGYVALQVGAPRKASQRWTA